MSICRFCAKSMSHHTGVKYAVRHYAHFECYLDNKPLSLLQTWKIESFPWKLLKERGLVEDVERIVAARAKPVEA